MIKNFILLGVTPLTLGLSLNAQDFIKSATPNPSGITHSFPLTASNSTPPCSPSNSNSEEFDLASIPTSEHEFNFSIRYPSADNELCNPLGMSFADFDDEEKNYEWNTSDMIDTETQNIKHLSDNSTQESSSPTSYNQTELEQFLKELSFNFMQKIPLNHTSIPTRYVKRFCINFENGIIGAQEISYFKSDMNNFIKNRIHDSLNLMQNIPDEYYSLLSSLSWDIYWKTTK